VSLYVDTTRRGWEERRPGVAWKVLWEEGSRRAVLMRYTAGAVIPRHRHLGEVHAYNLSGQRKLLETGQVVGPGGYVYEPAGNVDSWMAVGEEPVIVHITSIGAMDYLDENGQVLRRDTPLSLREAYLR